MRRPRPEDSTSRRARWSRLLAVVAICAVANAIAAEAAHAQAGAGAERYEVTITPPKRPGSEKPADSAAPVAAEPGAAPALSSAGTGSPVAPGAVAAPSPPAGAATAPASAAAQEASRAPSNLPLRTLQVGAYRQQSRAESLQDALSPTFENVTILEVQSGGESLYRVNVGRLPRGAALDDLKRRLTAAGFPAFEILAPAAAAKD